MINENSVEKELAEKRINHNSIEIDFLGSAGAGKSSYLSAMHRVLGYNLRGIKINRDVNRDWRAGEIIINSMKGINRSNATHISFDSLSVYAHIPQQGIVSVNFYAPGGHRASLLPKKDPAASVYFVDLELIRRAQEVIQQDDDFEFFPFKDNHGAFFGIYNKLQIAREAYGHKPEKQKSELLRRIEQAYQEINSIPGIWCDPDKPLLKGLRYAACRAFPLELFKEDELGVVIESALDAQLRLENRLKKGIPVIGVLKYNSRKPRITEERDHVQQIMNALLVKYKRYIGKKGFPYKSEAWSCMSQVHSTHNSYVHNFDFKGINEWHSLDSESCANMKKEIIQAAHSAVNQALTKIGIDCFNFRLVRFVRRNLEDKLTIHYDEL